MLTNTKERIIEYIAQHGQVRVNNLQKTLNISHVAIHRHLKKMLSEGIVVRIGTPPLVFYKLAREEVTATINTKEIPHAARQIIENNFLMISPEGRLLYGIEGFIYWMSIYQKNKPISLFAKEYETIWQEQKKQFSSAGWIDATLKIKDSFKTAHINHLLFQDIYSYKIFGRTRLAKLVMHAKQTGERKLIDNISVMAKPIIEKIIKKYAINAVAYIPPTVPRPVQFMEEFALGLNLSLPEVKLIKVVSGDIIVAQKTLSNIDERIINARETILLKNTTGPYYKNVLLIDDVVGSGASFNETAEKLKNNNLGRDNIIAFALVGNNKGYDVIREI